ncbi:MAG: hypothetical protein AB8B58_15505 [Roseobacter sp.]
MSEDESSGEDDHRKLSPAEEVAELYRLSDIVFGLHRDGNQPDVQQVVDARKRLVQLIESTERRQKVPVAPPDHSWVLNVLKDLSIYAETKGLKTLQQDVLKARDRLEKTLKDQ